MRENKTNIPDEINRKKGAAQDPLICTHRNLIKALSLKP